MELQFATQGCSCVKKVVNQVKQTEQTQELRLPDTMPDIGRVLGCWGQVVIRGKQWRSGEIGANGGVMVWVLYAPEDGSSMQTVESWIPFQMKWDLPQTQRDGTIFLHPVLESMDARSISARKLMLRCVVSILAEAMEPTESEYFVPRDMPDDVQLNMRTYPVELPLEAGEKCFDLEENVSAADFGRIIRYCACVAIAEQKVMASRLVFRGGVDLNLLYMDENGDLKTGKFQLPFAQYTDLDRDYSSGGNCRIMPILTGCEIQPGENGSLTVKASVSAQYMICDRVMLTLAEDAYSTARELDPKMSEIALPMVLDSKHLQAEQRLEIKDDIRQVLDTDVLWSHPAISRSNETITVEMPLQYRLLCIDSNGTHKTVEAKQVFSWEMPSDDDNQIDVYPGTLGEIHTELSADGAEVIDNASVLAFSTGTKPLMMVTGVSLGEDRKKDPFAPSLILRRPGGQSLWSIAKEYGTTIAAIEAANDLVCEPIDDRMLLIPVS